MPEALDPPTPRVTRQPDAVRPDDLFSLAKQAAGVAAWNWDLVHHKLHWSREIWPLFGLDPARPASLETWASVLHPDDLESASLLIEQAIQQRQPFVTTYRVILPDGETRWIDAYGSLILDEADRPWRFAGINVDATPRVQAQQGRQQAELMQAARQEAQRQAELRQRCLANLSHEVRTPVNAMVLLTQLLERQALPTAARDLVHKLNDVTRGLQGLLDNALDLARLEARQLQPESLPFDLGAVLDELVSVFADQAAHKGLGFSVVPPAGAVQTLVGDPYRLGQILRNLVGNAVKFTERGSVALRIDVLEALPQRLTLRFVVQDTGPGIDPALQPQLFQPFVQFNPSIGREFGGAGLGLAICRELVELMEGEIGVDSLPGSGSRFWFSLPFASQAQPEKLAPVRAELASAGQLAGVRILVVDDEPIGREVLAAILSAEGASVQQAEHGRAALDWLALHRTEIDIVLMDLNMPVMGGLAATASLREWLAPSELPVLAMTASTLLKERAAALAAGMNGFLTKPLLGRAELVAAIRQYLPCRPVEQPVEEDDHAAPASAVMNLAHGLSVCGGEEAYRDYLSRFVQCYQADLAALERASADRELVRASADRELVRNLAHRLKSAASYLGLERVAAVAHDAEEAMIRFARTEADSVRVQLHAVLAETLAAIAEFLSREPAATPEPPVCDVDQVRAWLEHSRQAASLGNLARLEQCLDALATSLPAARLSRLQDRVAHLDFAGAELAIMTLMHEPGPA